MFSRPRAPHYLLRQVAWGGVLAGLSIIAEDRYRRISFAQRVLENGRILQSHKHYQVPAPLSHFQGRLLNEEEDDAQSYTLAAASSPPSSCAQLTAQEWQTKGRQTRAAPGRYQSRYAYSETDAETKVHGGNKETITRAGSVCPQLPSYTHDQSTTMVLTNTQLCVQQLVFDRVNTCLVSSMEELNAIGRQQLLSIISPPSGCYYRPLQRLLELYTGLGNAKIEAQECRAFSGRVECSDASVRQKIALYERFEAELSTNAALVSIYDKPLSPAVSYNEDAARIPSLLLSLANNGRSGICVPQTEEDHSHVHGPLTPQTKRETLALIETCLNNGAFALGKDVIRSALASCDEYEPCLHHLDWVLEQENPDQRVNLCMSFYRTCIDRRHFERAANIWLASITWFHKRRDIIPAAEVLVGFRQLLDWHRPDENQKDIVPCHVEQYKMNNLDQIAVMAIDFLVDRNLITTAGLYNLCNSLIRNQQSSVAIKIYIEALRRSQRTKALLSVDNISDIFLEALVIYDVQACAFLARLFADHCIQIPSSFLVKACEQLRCYQNQRVKQHDVSSNVPGSTSSVRLALEDDIFRDLIRVAMQHDSTTFHLELFNIWTTHGHIQQSDLEDVFLSSKPPGDDAIVSIANRCLNLGTVGSRSLGVILMSCIRTQQVELVCRALREGSSLNKLASSILTMVSGLPNVLSNDEIRTKLMLAAVEAKAFGALSNLKYEVLQRFGDDKMILDLLYHSLAKYADLQGLPEFVCSLEPRQASSDILRASHELLLRRCWQSSGDFDLFTTMHEAIWQLDPSALIATQIYLDVARDLVCDRNNSERLSVLYEMLERNGPLMDLETVSMISISEAQQGRWECVIERLRAVVGNPARNGVESHGSLEIIFAEHCRQHPTAESLAFFESLSETSSRLITSNMAKLLIDRIVQEQDIALFGRLASSLMQSGLEMTLSKSSLELLMKRLDNLAHLSILPWLSGISSPQVEQKTLLGAVGDIAAHGGENGSYITTYLQDSSKLPPPNRRKSSAQSGPRLAQAPHTQVISEKRAIRLMLDDMRSRRYDSVINTYATFCHSRAPVSQKLFLIALHAVISREGGDLKVADAFIRNAEMDGVDTRSAYFPQLLSRFRTQRVTESDARLQIFKHYEFSLAEEMPFDHFLLIAAAKNQIQFSHRAAAGLRLIREVAESAWSRLKPLDLPVLTVALQLFFEVAHVESLEWIIEKIKAEGMRVDTNFLKTLRKGRKRMQKLFNEEVEVRSGRLPYSRADSIRIIRKLFRWEQQFAYLLSEQQDHSLDFVGGLSGISGRHKIDVHAHLAKLRSIT